ncbi:TlpA disulfide reductase family protein [Pilimelia columellifera]|uniref:Thioredoxin domain-containing protein n=1 Tax=Pilimelia columellifera subsp. columellifera TaxID=706583 RepID=A0ABP6A9A3_9ACTN
MGIGRRIAAAALALSAVGAVAACGGDDPAAAEGRCITAADGWLRCPTGDRSAAPPVAGELLDRGRYDLAAASGQVVVLNFWGSWCAPCRAEAVDLEAAYQATKGLGVAFVGVNIRDERDKALAFEVGRVTYPSLFDPRSAVAIAFDIPPNATPATVVIDRSGRVAAVKRGIVQRSTLEPVVREIAAEGAADAGPA